MRSVVITVVGLMISCFAWSQDQASGRTQTEASPRIPRGQEYLEAKLSKMKPTSITLDTPINSILLWAGARKNTLIYPECYEAAMENVTAGRGSSGKNVNDFVRCSGPQPLRNQLDPYLSTNYKVLTQNSYELTTACIKDFVAESDKVELQNIWSEGYFKMLSQESGLQVNVISNRNAIGPGQIMATYIESFKRLTLPDLRTHLKNHKSAICNLLGEKVLTDERINKLINTKTGNLNYCSNIDVEDGQPLINMVIGFSHLRAFKKDVMDGFMEDPKYKKLFSMLSPTEFHDLEVKITAWSYYTGPSRLRKNMKATLDSRYASQGRRITTVNDFIQNLSRKLPNDYLPQLESRYKNVLSASPKRSSGTCRAF